MSQVLFHLAERPDFVLSLREEIEAAIDAEGWTTSSFSKMWKLDSILRESQRYNGFTLGAPLSIADFECADPLTTAFFEQHR